MQILDQQGMSPARRAPWLRFAWPIGLVLLWIAAISADAVFFWAKSVEWLPTNRPDWALVWWLAGVALAITVVVGGIVGGAGRAPWYMRMASFAIGSAGATIALLLSYIGYMIAAPDPQGTNDDSAVVGALFLVIPTFLAVTVPLFIGGGLGALARRMARAK